MRIRKTQILIETIQADEVGKPCDHITRAAFLAVLHNPFAGLHQDDLSDLFGFGASLGENHAKALAERLPGTPIAYGKAALVGSGGTMEHGAALVHPSLGKPMRAAIGGGEALIPSNVKCGAIGALIDVPLGHKDKSWAFDYIDTMTVSIPDSPRADEIVVIFAYSNGTRAHPRVGSGPSKS